MPVPNPGKHRGEMTLISLTLSVDNHYAPFKFGSSTVVAASLNNGNFTCICIGSSGFIK